MSACHINMANIYDVARDAGVSIATVSRVFHGKESVGADLRERVLAAADQLGYRPHRLARALARGRRNILGLMLPTEISHPFYGLLAEGVARAAKEYGYEVMVGLAARPSTESYVEAATELQDSRVSGMLLCAGAATVRAFTEGRRADAPPVVAVGCVPEVDVPIVTVDEEKAGYELTRYLLGLGHESIAMLGWGGEPRALGREHGYVRAMDEAGLPTMMYEGERTMAGGVKTARELMGRGRAVTALMTFNDPMALGAMRGLHEVGLRVPEDMSVAGFDGIPQGACSIPALTTVELPVDEMARKAVDMLGRHVGFCEDDDCEDKILINPRLVVRDSCRPPSTTGDGFER
jgi:LacI family transcriptional regulator